MQILRSNPRISARTSVIVLLVFLLILWVLSIFFVMVARISIESLHVEGTLGWGTVSIYAWMGSLVSRSQLFYFARNHTPMSDYLPLPSIGYRKYSSFGPSKWSGEAIIPIWMIFLLTIILRAFLLWSSRPRNHECAKCRYNLTGNVSGICPECGTLIEDEQKAKLAADTSTNQGVA